MTKNSPTSPVTTQRKKDLPKITIDSLKKIWMEEEVVPMKFKPTGEIVYVTGFVADKIRKNNHE